MGYPGGKSGDGVFHKIINQIPPHDVYIEPFLGGGAIMLNKRRASSSIVIDRDADVLTDFVGLPGTLVECGDAISLLPDIVATMVGDGKKVFVYADPPYLLETRKSRLPIYKYEMLTEHAHSQLLAMLQRLPCMVALSGYWSSLYETSLQGWRSINFQARTRRGTATEWLWMNYPEPVELHDYSYLGENFREREKITRQRKRWRARLLRMSALQRYALLASIAELGVAS